MKTKGTKRSKGKNSETGILRTGVKLPKHKAKKKQIKKQGSFLKCLKMKSPRRLAITENRPGSSPLSTLKLKGDEKTLSPFTPKRKKKKVVVPECKEKECIVIPKDFTGTLLGPNAKSVEVPLNSCEHETESGHRNLGIPVIVEALSTSLTSLSIPESLQDQVNVISKDLSNEIIPDVHEEVAKEENLCILPPSPAIVYSRSQKDNRRRRNSLNVASPRIPTNIPSPRTPKNIPCPRTPLNVPSPSTMQDLNEQSTSTDTPCQNAEAEDCSNNNTVNDLNANTSMDNANAEESVSNQENAARHRNLSSNFIQEKNTPKFYCVRNKVIVIMKEKCRFCFAGKLILEVIHGSVQVYGCIVTPKSGAKEIYSPRGYSSVAIETYAQPEQNDTDAWPSLFAQGINNETKNKLVDDINLLQPGEAVILLSYLENNLTKFLQLYYPFRLFPKINGAPKFKSWTNPMRAEAILQSSFYFGPTKCKDLIFDSSLAEEVPEKILNSWRANEFSCTVIAGGKCVGKSTTAHYLINRLLHTSGKVILLDLDPGQSECTPSACISYSVIEEPMLGPNFTHLKIPVFQVFLGDVNVSRCVTRYIEGVKMLVDKLTSCPVLSRLPIIVNTMGFVQGLGWDIMMFTLKLLRPSLVVQIVSDRPRNNYQDFLSSEVVNEQQFQWATWCSSVVDWYQPCTHELHAIYSLAERRHIPGTENWNIEPYQKRELLMVSYLSQITNNTEDSTYSESSISINQVVPYATPFSALSISVPDACVPPSHALTVVNGNIVALCGIDMQTDRTAIQEDSTPNNSSPRLLTRAPLCACYGFGIVRGVDMDSKEVYINTPVPTSIMPHVNCLVGCMPIPVSLLQLNYFKNVPYTGGNDVIPTSREPRRGYFRMRFHNPQNPS